MNKKIRLSTNRSDTNFKTAPKKYEGNTSLEQHASTAETYIYRNRHSQSSAKFLVT
jgi:hypothetical protein